MMKYFTFFWFILFFLSLPVVAAPVLLFSDIESGPKSGWSDAKPDSGASVTVWGYGFGESRGQSYVSVNGVNLESDTDYANWGESWPTPFYQRITFWLNSQMFDGEGDIKVTINGETSNSLPFTIRAGRIFFIESDNPGGDGTAENPFDFSDTTTGSKWLTNMQAGDIFYFKDTSVYTERVNGGISHVWLRNTDTFGTPENPIALLAYPNHKPFFQVPSPHSVNFRMAFSLYNNHSVIAGLSVDSPGFSATVAGNYNRVIGNDFQASSGSYTLGTGIINVGGDGHIVLGNNVHGMRSGNRFDHGVYLNGCSPNEGIKLGWNYLHDNDFGRGPEIVVNHQEDRCPSNVYLKSHFIFNNIVHCDRQRSTAVGIYQLSYDLGETEPEPTYVYNNLIVSCGTYDGTNEHVQWTPTMFHTNGHARFYNNTLYDSGFVGFQNSNYTQVLSTHFKNNIVHMTKDFPSDMGTNYLNSSQYTDKTYIANNLFYGLDNAPVCDGCIEDANNVVNQDPLFIDPANFNFGLRENSPALNMGTNDLLFEVTVPSYAPINRDFNHLFRIGQFDIGAVEFNGGAAYSIGGTVSGLANGKTVVLQNSGGDNLTISHNGSFSFTTPIADGGDYEVSVLTHPSDQACSINNASGTTSGTHVNNINVSCSKVDSPILLFSDIESGPKNGWSVTEFNKGAAVTIWGYGFGDTRAQSYVTVNGVKLESETDYANWGEYWPTPFYQRVTFWLNNQMSDGLGEITITVNGQTSEPLPFTIRTGRILFIESDNPSGVGSSDNPYDFSDALWGPGWLTNMQAGDIFYFKDSSIYTERVNGGNTHLWLRNTNTSGTKDNPIAFLAYPNQKPVFQNPSPYSVNFRAATAMNNSYVVLSGLSVDSSGYGAAISGSYHRVIGNDFKATSEPASQGTGIINVNGDGHIVLGNNIHGMRSGKSSDHAVYFNGCSPNEGIKLGWNYLHDNNFGRGPEIYVYNSGNRCPSDVSLKSHYIFNNMIHCDLQRSMAIGISDLSYDLGETEPEPTYVYNNLIVSCGFTDILYGYDYQVAAMGHNNGHGRFYNNTLYDTGSIGFSSSTNELLLSSYFKNNIIHMNPNFSGSKSTKYTVSGNNNHLSNNLYFGIGEYRTCTNCVEDTKNVSNQDPIFVAPASLVFELQPASPAVDTGTNNLVFEVPPPAFASINRGINHVLREGIFDLGAMELNGGLPAFKVKGIMSGLAEGGNVVLQINASDDLSLTANGSFEFINPMVDGSEYTLTVLTQPTLPKQVCNIDNANGIISGTNVSNVSINCFNIEWDSDNDGIPDYQDSSPNTPENNVCSADHAVLHGTFVTGTQTSCRANLSITVASDVVIQSEAMLGLVSPQIIINPDMENKGKIHIKAQQP